MESAGVYSYHTFLFPFLYSDNGRVSMADFTATLDERVWQRTDWPDTSLPENNPDMPGADDIALEYQAYQYFNYAARRALYGFGASVMSRFTFDPGRVRNKSLYHIRKGENVYDLPLNGIKLRLYNTGIGVMIFEAENKAYRSVADVKNINEYGRRINAPFIAGSTSALLCADELGVILDGGEQIIDHMSENVAKYSLGQSPRGGLSLTYVTAMITRLLAYPAASGLTVTSDAAQRSSKRLFIEPAIDDRMLVCCLVASKGYFDSTLKGVPDDGQFAYQSVSAAKRSLYELMFIDKEGDVSCENDDMIDALFKDHLYARWRDVGTLHAVTHHSLLCVTGDADTDTVLYTVVRPFLKMYVDMFILVVVQRASIIAFSHRASEITNGIERPGSNVKGRRLRSLLNLQEAYIAFRNQLLFFEVTPQEQGVEIYGMMQRALYIHEEKRELEQQFSDLYEVATVNQSDVFNRGALVLALWSLLLSFTGMILQVAWTGSEFRGVFAYLNCWPRWIPPALLLALSLIILLGCKAWFSRKKARPK